jgi:hypothetical protein
MNEKIKWYKEVLELEPGSRIFFPLAKLLAEEESIGEAVETLRQGLVNHPDHVEARLMLVELLSKQQSTGAVRHEVDGLGSIFSAYPGFWQAWSENLSKNPDMLDASVAMRFFSETMHGRKLDWTAVIEAGLKALLLDDAGKAADRPEQSGVATIAAPQHVETPKMDISVSEAKKASGQEASAPLRVVSAKLKRVPPKKVTLESVVEASDTSNDSGTSAAAGTTTEESGEEDVSLRTRTMADVLADQGDFAAAAEIYHELADKAREEEKAQFVARYEELQARAAEAAPLPVPHEEDDDVADLDSPEGSKLVDLLESLAARLEERSR